MRHIIHDTIVLMQKERIVPSRGKNIFEDQQKAQHSVRSHANKYFIKRESFSRQFVSLVPSSVSVCLTTAKKRAQRVNNGFHSLMLTKKIVHQTDVSCPFEPKYKQMTDKFTREFIPFLFYMIYFKFFFRFCRISDFCITSIHVLWRKKNILELLYGFSILYFILPHFFHCFVIPSHILPEEEVYWHFPTPSRNNYTSIALTILNNRIIWSDFLQSAQIKVIWIQSVISVCSWYYALPYIFWYFPFFFFHSRALGRFFLLDAIAWFACLLFWFNSFGLVAAHWFGTHQFTCWNTSPAPLHWSLCFSTSKAESSRVNRLNEKSMGMEWENVYPRIVAAAFVCNIMPKLLMAHSLCAWVLCCECCFHFIQITFDGVHVKNAYFLLFVIFHRFSW